MFNPTANNQNVQSVINVHIEHIQDKKESKTYYSRKLRNVDGVLGFDTNLALALHELRVLYLLKIFGQFKGNGYIL